MSEHKHKHESVTTNDDSKLVTEHKSKSSSHKANKKHKKSLKGLWIGLSTTLVLAVIFLVLLLVPISGQTVASQGLDALGLHKQALILDIVRSRGFGDIFQTSSFDPNKPETCSALIDLSDYQNLDLAALSGTTYLDVRPVNSSYADKLNYNGIFQGALNAKDMVAEILIDNNANFDSDLVNKIIGNNVRSELGQANLNFKAGAKINREGGFLSLMNLALKSKEVSLEGKLNSWYKQDFNLTETQKQGVIEVGSVINELAQTKPNQVLSDESLKQIYSLYCSGIDRIDVGPLKTVEFGSGSYQVDKKVRPISVVMKADYQKILADKAPDVIVSITKDAKFRSFLKSQYDRVKRLAESLNKIDSSVTLTDFPSKEDYEKNIDEALNQVKREDFTNTATVDMAEESFTTNFEMSEAYLDLETMSIFGTGNIFVIKPTAQTMQSISEPTLADVVKDGIRIKIQNYNTLLGSKAKSIDLPADTKNFEGFVDDLGNLTPLDEISSKLFPENNSNSSVDNSENNALPPLPTGGDNDTPLDDTTNTTSN